MHPTQPPSPYRGVQSYQSADARVFFGRDRIARQLTARIEASTFTLLHAVSGAGKTSLLNARVVLLLERRGLLPVTIRLRDVARTSTRDAILRALLPAPAHETAALRRAQDALGIDDDAPLSALLAAYDALPVDDPDGRPRALVDALEAPDPATLVGVDYAGVVPWFVRVLRDTVPASRVVMMLQRMRGAASLPSDPPLGALHDLLRSEDLVREHARRLGDLVAAAETRQPSEKRRADQDPTPNDPPGEERDADDPPEDGLAVLARRAAGMVSLLVDYRGLVLVFDQFEELFTRYVHEHPEQGPTWDQRTQFLESVRALYDAGHDGRAAIRMVLSMRDDFIASTEPIRHFVQDFDDHRFRLPLLSRGEVDDVLRKPAAAFHMNWTDEAIQTVVDPLALEGQWIEAGHLQIVCARVWRELGEEGSVDHPVLVTRERLNEDVGSVGEVLQDFFRSVLDGLDDIEVITALLMLDQLHTTRGTRNIVDEEELLGAWYHARDTRRGVLDVLEGRRIVRSEQRHGGQFYEVTHEFLVAPIRDAIHERTAEDPRYAAVREAQAVLARLGDDDGRLTGDLQAGSYRLLETALPCLELGPPIAELLLRGTLTWGALQPDEATREHLGRLLAALEGGAQPLSSGGSRGMRRLLKHATLAEGHLLRHAVIEEVTDGT